MTCSGGDEGSDDGRRIPAVFFTAMWGPAGKTKPKPSSSPVSFFSSVSGDDSGCGFPLLRRCWAGGDGRRHQFRLDFSKSEQINQEMESSLLAAIRWDPPETDLLAVFFCDLDQPTATN
ncbi:hypothetical protein MRB53_035593 [Persea americana]|uniref:Uncharacterized protein n=1 Tax=Persea americana TaxID=3435 RepID=A0ACC2K5C8_PERAE|nr:hypothetical protein MRB53_035593 [Persea americana]